MAMRWMLEVLSIGLREMVQKRSEREIDQAEQARACFAPASHLLLEEQREA
jgi:hypothetical protein